MGKMDKPMQYIKMSNLQNINKVYQLHVYNYFIKFIVELTYVDNVNNI